GVGAKGAAFPAIISRPFTISNMPRGRRSRRADCQRNFLAGRQHAKQRRSPNSTKQKNKRKSCRPARTAKAAALTPEANETRAYAMGRVFRNGNSDREVDGSCGWLRGRQ